MIWIYRMSYKLPQQLLGRQWCSPILSSQSSRYNWGNWPPVRWNSCRSDVAHGHECGMVNIQVIYITTRSWTQVFFWQEICNKLCSNIWYVSQPWVTPRRMVVKSFSFKRGPYLLRIYSPLPSRGLLFTQYCFSCTSYRRSSRPIHRGCQGKKYVSQMLRPARNWALLQQVHAAVQCQWIRVWTR